MTGKEEQDVRSSFGLLGEERVVACERRRTVASEWKCHFKGNPKFNFDSEHFKDQKSSPPSSVGVV